MEREIASRTLAWEAAHVIDVMSFTDEQRNQFHALYHGGGSDSHGYFSGPYDDQVGEAFMEGLVAAYCPSLAADSTFSHETTPEVAEGIRQILE